MFVAAKNIEGCSKRTLSYYESTIETMLDEIKIPARKVTTEDMRQYLAEYFDVDFEARECVVFGKGGKERRVYFDAKSKLHLQKYIESRSDENEALFVSLDAPHNRLKKVAWRFG